MKWIIFPVVLVCLMCGFSTANLVAQTLKPYESVSHFSPERYVQQYERAFDTLGIVTQKKEYHALTISFFGIMNYDAFAATGDSSYYRHAVNQYNYFKDTSKLIFTDNGTCAGLPYRYNYKGLKAPWFSGMTQGVATSYLLRYYQLTGDKEALELSEKIIRFMLKPEADGGTIGRTKEGGPWIEEYPNYKSSKSVLNGFINGLIGLKEYCEYFPNDTYAKSIHDSCYREMIEHIYVYDTPAWTTYNRNGGAISNAYMRYELEEFDHLYSLYGDERLRRQMKIWSRFAIGKYDKEQKFLIHPKYDFATEVPFETENKGFTYDRSKQFFTGLKEIPLEKETGKLYAEIPQKTNYIQLRFKEGKTPKKLQVKAFSGDKEIKLYASESDTASAYESRLPIDRVELKVKKNAAKELQLAVYDYRSCIQPQFAWFAPCTPKYISKGQKITIEGKANNLTNAVVFYRLGASTDDLKKQVFRQSDSFALDSDGIIARETGMYEFFVCFDLTHPVSTLSGFEIRVTD